MPRIVVPSDMISGRFHALYSRPGLADHFASDELDHAVIVDLTAAQIASISGTSRVIVRDALHDVNGSEHTPRSAVLLQGCQTDERPRSRLRRGYGAHAATVRPRPL
jgi:hypothetical protein